MPDETKFSPLVLSQADKEYLDWLRERAWFRYELLMTVPPQYLSGAKEVTR